MAEATTTVTTSPTVSLTAVDNLFSISHQLFDQYRTAIFVLTGTCTFFSTKHSYYFIFLFQ